MTAATAVLGPRSALRPAGQVVSPRHELDDTLTEVTRLIEEAREARYDSDSTAERTHLNAARAQLADLIQRLADRITKLG